MPSTIQTKWTEIWHGEGPDRVNILADRGKPMTDSLRMTDQEAAANARTRNRVTLDSMLSKVEHVEYWHPGHTPHMTICILTMENGFVVVGSSAPADAANYDENLGQKFAHEDCIRQLWRFEGYLLCDKLSRQADGKEIAPVDAGGPEEGAEGQPGQG